MHIIILLIIACVFASSFAWLPPERCQQIKTKTTRSNAHEEVREVPIVPSIEEVRASQHRLLVENYKDYKFPGIPISATGNCLLDDSLKIYTAHNCTFYSYNPRMLGSMVCQSNGCKLTRSVATTESYTSSEGYNWGVKISAKWTILDKVFEVGAEASTGGTYTCAYTKGKTTTLTAECSQSSGEIGQLQLYNILTDMKCDIGTISLEKDPRDNGESTASTDFGFFTQDEDYEIIHSGATSVEPCNYNFFIDPSKISDRLFQKIMRRFPLYDPFTDVVSLNRTKMFVNYRKIGNYEHDYTKIIPFTNENGDAVYQYACLFT